MDLAISQAMGNNTEYHQVPEEYWCICLGTLSGLSVPWNAFPVPLKHSPSPLAQLGPCQIRNVMFFGDFHDAIFYLNN